MDDLKEMLKAESGKEVNIEIIWSDDGYSMCE